MKLIHTTAICAAIATGSLCHAAVPADKAEALGTTLTAVGAEKGGNADGTIPPYEGGLSRTPAGIKVQDGKRPNPFAGEKASFSIKGDNVARYADKLTAGAQELLKRHPDFRIDVYPTHRTAAFSPTWYANTKKCATTSRTLDGGIGLESPQRGCVPFPIPHDGYEAMWNHLVHERGASAEAVVSNWNVDSAGHTSLSATVRVKVRFIWEDDSPGVNPEVLEDLLLEYQAPARHDGERLLLREFTNEYKQRREAWQYLPGQRRVRLAPDLNFDAPNSTTNGTNTTDDNYLFNGSMERYDMKLVGKKEIYVPYNDYDFTQYAPIEKSLLPKFVNPDNVRWELHRVWVIEATLKPGKRHIYSRRTFYLDEDSWAALASDEYDSHGQLYRVGFAFGSQHYDTQTFYTDATVHYDLIGGGYAVSNLMAGKNEGLYYDRKFPAAIFTPGSLTGSGVR